MAISELKLSTPINDCLKGPSPRPTLPRSIPSPAPHSEIPGLAALTPRDRMTNKQICVRCRLTEAEFFHNSSSKNNLKLYLNILANYYCTQEYRQIRTFEIFEEPSCVQTSELQTTFPSDYSSPAKTSSFS